MAENFGKQFTVAREKLGFSVSEVSSKIKIRDEYIEGIETGKLDFNLPDIYIRGFVKNYAKFLKLNVESVMKECPIPEFRVSDAIKIPASALVENVKVDSEEIKDSKPKKKNQRDFFAHIFSELKNLRNRFSNVSKRSLLIFFSIFVVIILATIFTFVVKRSRNEFDISGIVPAEAGVIPAKSIVLSAIGSVNVVARDKGTLESIFRGNLASGMAKTISYYKPIQLFYDHGEYLLIQRDNGEKVYPQPGRGGIEIK